MQYSLPVKTIFVLRHGKSDWHQDYGSDHDRPLAERGITAAGLMGRFLTQNSQVPAKIISSTAVRARKTAELAIAAGDWDCPAAFTKALYGASVSGVLDLLRGADDAIPSLLLVGHQPTWSELVAELTAGNPPHFPTAAMARIDLEVERWRDVQPGAGVLRWLVTPKVLKNSGFDS